MAIHRAVLPLDTVSVTTDSVWWRVRDASHLSLLDLFMPWIEIWEAWLLRFEVMRTIEGWSAAANMPFPLSSYAPPTLPYPYLAAMHTRLCKEPDAPADAAIDASCRRRYLRLQDVTIVSQIYFLPYWWTQSFWECSAWAYVWDHSDNMSYKLPLGSERPLHCSFAQNPSILKILLLTFKYNSDT